MLVVDEQELRAGLRGLLHTRYGFDIVAECADGSEVATAVAERRPYIVVRAGHHPASRLARTHKLLDGFSPSRGRDVPAVARPSPLVPIET